MTDLKIGNVVDVKDFNGNNEIVGSGIILGKTSQQPLSTFWIVLLTKKNTDFLKAIEDKAFSIPDSYLELSSDVDTVMKAKRILRNL